MVQSRSLLVYPITAFLVLGVALVWFVVRLLKSNQSDILVSAPMAAQQEIRVPVAGPAILLVETPRMASDYAGMQLELLEEQSGQKVTFNYSRVTAEGAVYGFSTAQVPFGRVTLRSGAYIARVNGLQAGKDYSRYRLMISRPYLGRMALQIIALVVCGVGMLLSLIWAAWLAGWMKPAQPV